MAPNSVDGQQMALKDKIDMRPKSSQYAYPLIALHFADGPPLAVPRQLLEKSAKLSSCRRPDMTLRLTRVPSGAGHVLVHYLYTGTYECLSPKGASYDERYTTEFATAVRVYTVARDYGLPELESLAKAEVEKLGDRMHAMQVLDVLRNTFPTANADDIWLQTYLKSVVRKSIDSPLLFLSSPSDSAGHALSFPNALLKVFVQLWGERSGSSSPSPDDLIIDRDRPDEPIAADVNTEPAVSFDHEPIIAPNTPPKHEESDFSAREDLKEKPKMKEKERRTKDAECPSITSSEDEEWSKVGRGRGGPTRANTIASTTFPTADFTISPLKSDALDAFYQPRTIPRLFARN